MMSRDDWFRNTRWFAEIEQELFVRIGCARTQRDQYLVLQPITLVSYEPESALRLVDRYFETRTDLFHDGRALLARAEDHVALGQDSKAVNAYKAVLTWENRNRNHRSYAKTDLLYLIAEKRLKDEYDFALTMISDCSLWLSFPNERFKFYAALALMH